MPSLLKTPCDTGNFLEILRPFGIKVAPGNLEFKNYCENGTKMRNSIDNEGENICKILRHLRRL